MIPSALAGIGKRNTNKAVKMRIALIFMIFLS
jgi:hypothetical protein